MKVFRLFFILVVALVAVPMLYSHAAAAPDLLILRGTFNWTPERIEDGTMVTVNYMVANNGDATADSFHVGLRVGGTIVAKMLIADLEPIHRERGTFMWRAVCADTEATEWAVVADCDAEIAESDELNNTYTHEAFACYVPPPLPNLHVDHIYRSGSSGPRDEITAGIAYTFRTNVRNDDAYAGNVRVKVGIIRGAVIYDRTFTGIGAGNFKEISFKYSMSAGLRTLYVEVDPDNTIEESNEEDNRSTRRFNVGDANGPVVAPDTSPPSHKKVVHIFNLEPKVTNKAAIAGRTFHLGDTIVVRGMVTVKGDPKVNSAKVFATLHPPHPHHAVRKEVIIPIQPKPARGIKPLTSISKPFRLSWVLEHSGRHGITVNVSEVPGESSISDNHLPGIIFNVDESGPASKSSAPKQKSK